MRRYASLSIKELLSDVAVDPMHVRELADSIKVSGPISPVLVREENLTLIDGFHRVAAMRELGFQNVECILTPCDDETFWDLRIIAASTHKSVTFSRVIEWIDEVFRLSPWAARYKSAFSLFDTVGKGGSPEEVRSWVTSKSQKWGLAPGTIRNWLQTAQDLSPELLEEAKASSLSEEALSVTHYGRVARTIPNQPGLQRDIIEKAKREGLSTNQIEQVARAVRRAEGKEEVQSILRQPASRTEDQIVRDAKVEKILHVPLISKSVEGKQIEFRGKLLEYFLDLENMAVATEQVTNEMLDVLPINQKEQLIERSEKCNKAIQRIIDHLRGSHGRLIESAHQIKG
jgi:ParB-like chromosome segregation protein Spo0J